MPEHPLDSVQAAIYFLTFEKLPYPGGTFDQPSDLMREMSYVLSEYRKEQERQARSRLKDD